MDECVFKTLLEFKQDEAEARTTPKNKRKEKFMRVFFCVCTRVCEYMCVFEIHRGLQGLSGKSYKHLPVVEEGAVVGHVSVQDLAAKLTQGAF